MDLITGKERVKEYYDQEAKGYKLMYEDGYEEYPANRIRLNIILDRFKKTNVKTVLDIGCGTCMPMISFLKEGYQVKGFDFSEEMVKNGKKEVENAGFNPDLVFHADLEQNKDLPEGKFDAVTALGVFPHLLDEGKALSYMHKRLKDNGRVFIEFRNDLFAAYTLNKYSLDFFLNRVIDLSSLPNNASKEITHFYQERLKVDVLPQKDGDEILYTEIFAKLHNPLSIEEEIFKPNGFSVIDIHFYHYHSLPPIFEKKYPDVFRETSLKMEKPNDWRGYLMASAFVVEAKKDAETNK